MSDNHQDPQAIRAHIRVYLIVGAALLVGTILTVWASYINFGTRTMNIVVALIIATVKASLVAGFFMHLISERRAIYLILCSTAFFFVGLMFLTIWAMNDFPNFTTFIRMIMPGSR
jgi:cytochrome c oxidase subunit 4